MVSMVENQWNWLRPYVGIARWVGWLLLIFGALTLAQLAYGSFELRYVNHQPVSAILAHSLEMAWNILRNVLLPGTLALGVSQFLRWLVEKETRPGWLLRLAPTLLVFTAAVYLVQVGLMVWRLPGVIRMINKPEYTAGYPVIAILSVIVPNFLIGLAPVIIFFGLSEALRRIGPIVDESKELV